ncbi:MAG: YihY/virulence factor BrkB family protein [Propionibacteriaceae bacterium]|jgi:membrane protein|nr:YihY/virulence factor BrkB family protein [Propionibacteriaceae bacterium]
MRERWERFGARPVVLHVRRAALRYRHRLGPESAAAMAFFSILTVVPTLVFAAIGAALLVTGPIQRWLAGLLDDSGLSTTILVQLTGGVCAWDAETQAMGCDLANPWAITKLVLGAVILVGYSGGNWMRHLARALNMIWRADADDVEVRSFVVWRWAKNIGQFLAFAALVLLSLATSTLATRFSAWLLDELRIEHSVGGLNLLRLGAVVGALVVGWCLFVFVLRVIPSYRQPFGSIAQGALLGAVAWLAVQQASSLIIAFFARGQTAKVFGTVFVVLVVFNVFSQVTLFVAAWTATGGERQVPKRVRAPRPEKNLPDTPVSP